MGWIGRGARPIPMRAVVGCGVLVLGCMVCGIVTALGSNQRTSQPVASDAANLSGSITPTMIPSHATAMAVQSEHMTATAQAESPVVGVARALVSVPPTETQPPKSAIEN